MALINKYFVSKFIHNLKSIMFILVLTLSCACKNELKYKLGPLLIPPILPHEIKGYVSTIAGNKPWWLFAPIDVAKDNNGNLYVLDNNNHIIRKFSPNGEISILAGNTGVIGSADGIGSSATFNFPNSIAIDNNQNIIVAELNSHSIRKVTPTGVVTTIAGSGAGYVDGNGINSKFNSPVSVAVDSSNNIFVADYLNNAIRMINPSGDVTTFAGGTQGTLDGVGAAAQFYKPTDVAFDSLGNLFVADSWNFSIRKITPGAVVSTFAGGGSWGTVDGNGTTAKFKFPYSLALDSQNNIFVSDPDDHTIRKITPTQDVTTFAGSIQGSVDGTGTQANFYQPRGLYIDIDDSILVAEFMSNKIRKINSQAVVTTLLDNSPRNKDGLGRFAQFNGIRSLVQDSFGNFFIVDAGNKTIRKMSLDGNVTTFAGGTTGNADGTGTAAQFNFINQMAIDSVNNLYVSDLSNFNIRKITPLGVVTTLTGGTSGNTDGLGTAAQFAAPNGIAIDKSNNLYVTDINNHSIRKITPAGLVTTIAGGVQGYTDANGLSARFSSPRGIAIDSNGNLFVADYYNQVIRKISNTGEVSTFAGSTSAGFTDGIGTAAQFWGPFALTIDSSNNLYVGDLVNYAIRKITPTGIVTTIAGNGIDGNSDGYKGNTTFSIITGLAVSKEGYLYIADYSNNLLRKIE